MSHSADVSEYRSHMRNVFLLASRPIRVLPGVVPKNISQEFRADKRFHPTVIGTILVIFIVTVAAFISYMEGHTYFDSVYACFITYSTIGFGDITIYVSATCYLILIHEQLLLVKTTYVTKRNLKNLVSEGLFIPHLMLPFPSIFITLVLAIAGRSNDAQQ